MTITESTTSKKSPRRRWWPWVAAVVVILIGGAVGLVAWNKSASRKFAVQMADSQPIDVDVTIHVQITKSTPVQTPQPQPIDADARDRKLVLGTWEDHYEGKRTMILNEDGTGTMLVELSGWRAALSAPRLKFNMKWSLQKGRLKKQTISGEPETQVKMILSTMGDHVDEPILELTEDHLLLMDQDGKTKYNWKRVKK